MRRPRPRRCTPGGKPSRRPSRNRPMMRLPWMLMLAACFALPGWAQAQAPAVVAAAADNGWDSSFFSYERTDELAVEISTPTPQQIDFRNRPPQYDGGEPLPQPTAVLPNPVVIGDMAVHHLRFQSVDGDVIAALLCTPADR